LRGGLLIWLQSSTDRLDFAWQEVFSHRILGELAFDDVLEVNHGSRMLFQPSRLQAPFLFAPYVASVSHGAAAKICKGLKRNENISQHMQHTKPP
jgi:hypothetical protein